MDASGFIWYCKIFVEVCWLILMVIYYIFKSWVEFFYVKHKDLSKEVVLLTGAAGGFGSLLAKKLSKKGCIVILLDIDGEKVNKLAESINISLNSCRIFPFCCDITKVEEIECVSDKILNSAGYPSMIINNAGTLAGKYFEDITYYDIHNTFNVNTFSHYGIIHQFLPHMLEQNHGHIVSISSILAVTPAGGLTEYAASKAAATAFMHALRQEIRLLGKSNVFCTNILPFQVDTKLFMGCKSRFPNFPFMSIQNPDYVTDKIIEAIEKNQITLYIPRILYVMCSLYHLLPAPIFDIIYDVFNVNTAMKTHVGHNKGS